MIFHSLIFFSQPFHHFYHLHQLHHFHRMEMILLISAIITMVVSIVSVGFILARAARRDMHLRASLIKQMEATRQAETKSMNKSLAIASASHDIRASLAGITGLIEISYDEAVPGSQVETNLKQMEACIKDLLGILNSFLDTSKIEAGKMQLEEDRFDVAQLLEDVVDLYHPVGVKKGVDVVLDPFDGSIMKFSRVKGDRGKLKQILCNLLSNALKFTSDGHVTVRAWARKPSLNNSVIASNQNGYILRHLCCMFQNNEPDEGELETMDDPNAMDFVFEVDDTGKGIPKDKHRAVFENYVQVKETALGLGGTGLGLGIVQSLVRLMHGEIGIVDKEIGEKGSCFRFNVILSVCEAMSYNETKEDNIEIVIDSMNVMHQDESGITSQTHSPRFNIQKPSPRLIIHSPSFRIGGRNPSSPKAEGSNVVLLIKNHERRIISKKFMERLGIKVIAVDQWEQLVYTLKKIKHKRNSASDCLSKSAASSSSFGAKDHLPLTSMDGNNNYTHSPFKKAYLRGMSGFILLVIDVTAGPFQELCKIVSRFRSQLHSDCFTCKVVWLANPLLHDRIGYDSMRNSTIFESDDIIKHKPFHGTCLYEVVKLLPEFGGAFSNRASVRIAKSPSSSCRYNEHGLVYQERDNNVQEEINEKPLKGKRVLIAEDSRVLGKLAKHQTSKLGAIVELCEDGKEALELVCNGFVKQMKQGGSPIVLPYDYILMDFEMPNMDGCEATRQIRKIEEAYGVHIPVIALTAHTSGEEAKMTTKAGMDAHLCKPLKSEHLLEAIKNIHNCLPTRMLSQQM